ncbi:hypothetical protein RB653_007864 [Dictyostelium firmibasis]|uniref:Uncharacterized protein n=1 Tax=Dictyostelium firmibasis TaxID=79012 RepID=A0AAN7U1W0_9MYCE
MKMVPFPILNFLDVIDYSQDNYTLKNKNIEDLFSVNILDKTFFLKKEHTSQVILKKKKTKLIFLKNEIIQLIEKEREK